MTSSSTDIRQIRIFGTVALLFFGSLSAAGVYLGRQIPPALFGMLSLIGLGLLLLPKQLRPVYEGWLRAAHLIGTVTTLILLTLVYFLAVTPTALLKRLWGGRPLPLKPDRAAASYWRVRKEGAQARERFFKRY